MTPEDKSILKSLGVFISPEVVNRYHHKQTAKEPSTRFYYFVERQKTYVPPENVSYDYEVSSTLSYKKNCFYKMSHLSNLDAYFDFFFMLKDECPKTVVRRKNIATKRKGTSAGYSIKHGNFVVSFD
jgi:hypothetical protein